MRSNTIGLPEASPCDGVEYADNRLTGAASPVSPCGIVKFRIAFCLVPVFVTCASVPGAPVVTEVVAVRYDVNGDGVFNQVDITAAQSYYQFAEGDPQWDEARLADLTGDGVVDLADLVELAHAWLVRIVDGQ